MTTAVHFGAGNIGRGFVGLLLHEAGYEIVFADVNAELISALQQAPSYTVHEVGPDARDHLVTAFRAVNSAEDEAGVIAEVAAAGVVSCAVGPTVLRFIAPVIAAGLRARDEALPRVAVMACENAIGATDLLREHVIAALAAAGLPQEEQLAVLAKAIFANTAVDRIVPAQDPAAGLDVTVESYHEWAIEAAPFAGATPSIPGAHFVDDLAPYIERKLFTVNTGHATIAYHGVQRGAATISDALEIPEVEAAVRAVLGETAAMLSAKHGIPSEELAEYGEKILARFRSTALSDDVRRVGRQPLRKLSRHERFIDPAATLAENGQAPVALLQAVGAALRFDDPEDEQSVQLQALLASEVSADAVVAEVTGLRSDHPLAGAVAEQVVAVREERLSA